MDRSHSDWCEMVPHSGFDLHFSDNVDHFLSLYECVTILLLLFMFCVFGNEACGISAPCPGIKPLPSALEGEVLTAGPPGKSHTSGFVIPSM